MRAENKIRKIEGNIASGLGEGALFLSMPHYRNGIKKKLGFRPFEGTLNIRISSKKLKRIKR